MSKKKQSRYSYIVGPKRYIVYPESAYAYFNGELEEPEENDAEIIFTLPRNEFPVNKKSMIFLHILDREEEQIVARRQQDVGNWIAKFDPYVIIKKEQEDDKTDKLSYEGLFGTTEKPEAGSS